MVSILQYLNSSIAGILAILFISFYFFRRSSAADHPPKPPEAPGGWPLIGHLRLLGGSGDPPYITLGALADKYGPIFSIRMGVHPAVVVSSWEIAKECFTTHDVIVSSRPKFTAAKILGYNYANFGFSPYGAFWREMRKITASELLSGHRLESLKNIRESELESSLKDLYRLWSIKKDSSENLLVEMKQWLGDINLNVILRMIAGKRYSGDAADEEEVRRCRRVFREFFRLTGMFIVGDALPFLGWLDLGGHVKDMKRAAKEMDRIMCEWLEEHRRKRESSGSGSEQDFIDVMLSVLEKADLEGFDVDTVNKGTCSVCSVLCYPKQFFW